MSSGGLVVLEVRLGARITMTIDPYGKLDLCKKNYARANCVFNG